jgi:transcriptional antiterminator NusG
VIKVLPGKERQLAQQFNDQISLGKVKDIIRFLCPTEKEYVVVKNKKILREKIIYTGYLYFETENRLSEDQLKEISTTPNIMAIMGDKKPILMRRDDIEKILKDDKLEEHIETKRTKYDIGEYIIVQEGPFKTFGGTISQLHEDKVDVEILIFGRKTPITLNFEQISKVV